MPTLKKILTNPILEVITEYPVEKTFFSGSKVLRIHIIPTSKDREVKSIVIEKLVKRKDNITNTTCEMSTILKLTTSKKYRYTKKPKLINDKNIKIIQRTLSQR
jgi:hypothetical protein